MAERQLGTVLADLAATRAGYEAATHATDRIALRDRLNRLRAEAASVRGSEVARMSDDRLDAAIRTIERLLADLRSARFDPSQVAGATGYGGGLDPILTARHNQRVDAEGGRAQLQAKLDELRRERARRT